MNHPSKPGGVPPRPRPTRIFESLGKGVDSTGRTRHGVGWDVAFAAAVPMAPPESTNRQGEYSGYAIRIPGAPVPAA